MQDSEVQRSPYMYLPTWFGTITSQDSRWPSTFCTPLRLLTKAKPRKEMNLPLLIFFGFCPDCDILIYAWVVSFYLFCYAIGLKNIRIRPSTRIWILGVFKNVYSRQRVQKVEDSRDTCRRKVNPQREIYELDNFQIGVDGA